MPEQDLFANYTSTRVFSIHSFEKTMRLARHFYRDCIRRYMPEDKKASILDAGCGFGKYVLAMNEDGFVNVVGVDISAEQIEFGKSRLSLSNLRLGDVHDYLKSSTDALDMVLLLDVLEHMPVETSLSILHTVHSALRIGGRILVHVPNSHAPFNPGVYDDLTHVKAFTAASLCQLFRLAGFSEYEFRPSFPSRCRPAGFVRHYLWKFLYNPVCTMSSLALYGDSMGGIFTAEIIAIARKTR